MAVRDLTAAASERARVAGPVGRDAGAQPGPRGRGAPAEGTRLLALSLLASASSLPVKSSLRAHPATPVTVTPAVPRGLRFKLSLPDGHDAESTGRAHSPWPKWPS